MSGRSGRGECVREATGVSSMFRLIRRDVTLTRILSTLDLIDLSGRRNRRGGNGTGPGCVVHDQLLEVEKKAVSFLMNLQK